MKKNKLYIALGSNEGNRITHLTNALQHIYERIGDIVSVSNLYETPSWGFEGNDFINACIEVDTRFSVEESLEKLMQIEFLLGRKRNSHEYENRSIDLDILFFNDEIIVSEQLVVPHPRMKDRKFVLLPLCDVAPNVIHPELNKTVTSLLNETSDTSAITQIEHQLTIPRIDFNQLNYLAIEGNIGAGKTSLASMIAEDYNAKLISERYRENPFLPKFYKDQLRYAFPLEMSFLADRYQQLSEDISQYDMFNDFMVADYDVYKSLIFAKVTLQEEEFGLYRKLFDIMYKQLPKPDLYIYLYQNTERLLANIKQRGRDYEQNIPTDYLEKINQGYLDFIKAQHHLNVKILDISELDFVRFREDYIKLIELIAAQHPPKNT